MATSIRYQSDAVAGASAEGYGILTGWSGSGELTHARLVEIASSVPGVLATWLPSPKDPGVQLTRAIREHAATHNVERVAKSTWDRTVEPREWSSRWLLVAKASTETTVGTKIGEVALRATLYLTDDAPGYELQIETSNDGLAIVLRAAFDAKIATETYQASDVTAWLAETIRARMGGVRYGGNWYVSRASRATAEGLCDALRASGWGKAWMVPALPIATSAQLAAGVANGLSEECGEIAAIVRRETEEARKESKLAIGERRAESLAFRLRDVGKRIASYRYLLGDDLATCHGAFCDAMIELTAAIPTLNVEAEWSALVPAGLEAA